MTKKLRENFYILVTSNLCTIILVFVFFMLWQGAHSSNSIESIFSLPNTLYIILCVLTICAVFAFLWSTRRTDIVINNNITPTQNAIQSSMDDKVQEKREQYIKKQEDLHEAKLQAICEYTIDILSPFVSSDNIELLCQNIRLYDIPESVLSPIVTNGNLNSVDLRHYAWNIGERLGWNGQRRSTFIKICFPKELANYEIETLRRTLRYDAKCQIELDIPDDNDYHFKTI